MQVPPDDSMEQMEAWGRFAAWMGVGDGWRLVGRGYADRLGIEITTAHGTLVLPAGEWIIREGDSFRRRDADKGE